jgi:hypothetical protein
VIDGQRRVSRRNGAQDRGQLISYSRVFDADGLPPSQDLRFGGESQFVTLFMARLRFRCRERTLPPLDALSYMSRENGQDSR